MSGSKAVIDANVAAAALIKPDGWTAEQLDRDDVDWLAPSFLRDELEEHEETYADKTGLELDEWRKRANDLFENVEFVPAKDLTEQSEHPYVERAEQVDEDDAPYLAAFVATGTDYLWTNDKDILDEFPGIAVRHVPKAN